MRRVRRRPCYRAEELKTQWIMEGGELDLGLSGECLAFGSGVLAGPARQGGYGALSAAGTKGQGNSRTLAGMATRCDSGKTDGAKQPESSRERQVQVVQVQGTGWVGLA